MSHPAIALALPGLYAVTPDGLPVAVLLERVEQALAAGVRLLQFRAKPVAGHPQRAAAEAVARLCRSYDARLIVNDDAELARAIDADGVHLGRDDGRVQQARQRLGQHHLIGVSCYDSLARAHRAVDDGADYVAFGAMYPSAVKPAAVRAPLNLLARARAEIRLPIVAIGGIEPGNAAPVLAAGADSVAVISAIFAAPDIGAAVRTFQQVIASTVKPQ